MPILYISCCISSVHTLFHLLLTVVLQGREYCFHFTDEPSEVLKGIKEFAQLLNVRALDLSYITAFALSWPECCCIPVCVKGS